MNILFVDDIEDIRNIVKDFLESQGFDIDVAASGVEALNLLTSTLPDLIISDILMPDMDGFEFCYEVRKNAQTSEIPFVFYTSTYLSPQDREFAEKLGVTRYLIKPMRLGDLLTEIRNIMGVEEAQIKELALIKEGLEGFDSLHSKALARKLNKKVYELDNAKKEIKNRHARFVHLINSVPEPVVEVSSDYRIVYANSAFLEWLSCNQQDSYGSHLKDIFGESFQMILKNMSEARENHFSDVIYEIGLNVDGRGEKEYRINVVVDYNSLDERYVVIFTKIENEQEIDKKYLSDELTTLKGTFTDIDNNGVAGTSEPVLGITGKSEQLASLTKEIQHVAPTNATVLIQGESGTGKELIANAIHALSYKHSGPLVKVNCGAIAQGVFESELFGHEKGAFTGATHRRIGRFEQANGGTIFLDEISELSAEMQVKLLRVLQEGVVERVGGTGPIKVNVRLIAATNADLEQSVQKGEFRLDLFYRLNVFPVNVPPLRERSEDIPLLVDYFLKKFSKLNMYPVLKISERALQALMAYHWPGNIRQLQNVIERAVIVAKNGVVQVGDLGITPLNNDHSREKNNIKIGKTLVEVEKAYIVEVLNTTNWLISGEGGAAEILGMNPSTLRSRMQKYGIRRR